MKTIYLECMSGIAGDMMVAALLDLGADPKALAAGLESLGVQGYRTEITRVKKSGIDACKFDVILEEAHAHSHGHAHGDNHGHIHKHDHKDEHSHPHDHAHGDNHGHIHKHDHKDEHSHHHSHDHKDEHGHHHDHSHGHEGAHSHSHGHHAHRNLGDITSLILASGIPPAAKETALRIFRVVAEAEAKVHGLPVEEVHFHEVGAVDSIVDIVGTAICLHNLGIDRVICSPLREGTGTVRCQHGVMPVPAPATLEIIRSHRIPLVITDNSGEMVTPTGAAIAAALAEDFAPPRNLSVLAVGYGAGTKEFKIANVLRAMLVREAEDAGDQVLKLECNLDDMTGEALSYAAEKLLEGGALDVWTTPVQMKKGRPGHLLSLLCREDREAALTELLFLHTTTIGVRVSAHRRHVMERREITLDTPYGPVAAKESRWNGILRAKAEFDGLRALAEEHKVPLSALAAATEPVSDGDREILEEMASMDELGGLDETADL